MMDEVDNRQNIQQSNKKGLSIEIEMALEISEQSCTIIIVHVVE